MVNCQFPSIWSIFLELYVLFYLLRLFKASGFGRPFGSKCNIGDRMGCGIKFKANEGDERPQPDQAVQVFFTRNGQEVNILSFIHYQPYLF